MRMSATAAGTTAGNPREKTIQISRGAIPALAGLHLADRRLRVRRSLRLGTALAHEHRDREPPPPPQIPRGSEEGGAQKNGPGVKAGRELVDVAMKMATTKRRKARGGCGVSLTRTLLGAPQLRRPPSPQPIAADYFTGAIPAATRTTSTIASKTNPKKVDSGTSTMPYLRAGVALWGGTKRPTLATRRWMKSCTVRLLAGAGERGRGLSRPRDRGDRQA